MSERESAEGDGLNDIERTDKEHVFGTWSYQKEVSPTQVVDADGVRFTTADGDEYIDFSSQLMCSNLGHSADRIADAVDEQMRDAAYVSPGYTTENRAKLGETRRDYAGELSKTFLSTSGTEAVEAAIKIARFYTGKQKIISRYRSYHGATYGSISVTGDPVVSSPSRGFRGRSRHRIRTPTARRSIRWRASSTSTRCSNSRGYGRGDPGRTDRRLERDPRPARRVPPAAEGGRTRPRRVAHL